MIKKQEFIRALIANHKNPWNIKALEETALFLKLDKEYHRILFPEGLREIYELYENRADELMYDTLTNLSSPQKTREKIALALEVRIIELGTNTPLYLGGIKASWNTADIIWRYAGDKSTDFNHYTKRMLLSGIYLRARQYYLKDHSQNHTNTKEYIKNAIDKVLKIAKLKHKIPKIEEMPILRLFL
jgi:ubiquinone biosynthesis protein COQ9